MNEKKIKQLNTLAILTIFAALISIFTFIFGFSPENKNSISADSLEELSRGWVLKDYRNEPDTIIKLPEKVKADAEEVIVLMNRVPENVTKSSILMFETKFQNVIVMINDTQVYANGVLNEQKLMKNAVPCVNVVDIGIAEPGDIISIYMVSSYKSYSGEIPAIYHGTRGDAVASIIRRNGVSFVASVTLLIIILVLFISLLLTKEAGMDKRRTIYAFIFAFAASLWSLFNNPILQLITDNIFGVYMTDMVILLILPTLYLLYHRSLVTKKRLSRIFEIAIYIFSINFLTGVVFQMLSVCDFASYMVFTKILITLGLIGLSVIMYIAADTYSDRKIYGSFWANNIITASCVLEGFFSFMTFYSKYDGVILQTGILIFIVMMVINAQKQSVIHINKEREYIEHGAELEKSAVLSNINSKFIYSSLNIVMNNLKERDKDNSRHIYDTSIYMKHNIDVIKNRGKVPFELELDYIRAYLGMATHQNAGLEVLIEDKITDFVVPYSSIELLVENAVVNGALKALKGSRIVIRSYERLDCYAIQIVDNGPGIGPDKKFHDKQGFKAVKKRLKDLCGGAIEIKAKPDRGTIVTVKIPKAGYIIKE